MAESTPAADALGEAAARDAVAADAWEPRLWRLARAAGPELELTRPAVKRAFWRGPNAVIAMTERVYLDVNPDKLSEHVLSRAAGNPSMRREVREADKELEYDPLMVAKMERTTPQFNLRNVMRVTRDVDLEWLEWGRLSLPDRHGYEADLKEVRTARIEPPVFFDGFYASSVNRALRAELHKVFRTNDWERWYGEDKKRATGAMWRYVPEDGGVRTRPWPKMNIRPYLYWKGRLITEEF